MKSAASSRFVAKARHCRPARSRAWAAAGSGSVVCDVRCEGHSAPTVGPHDRLHRGRGPPEALALQVRPHLQAAVQAFRWAFALGVGFVVAGQDFGDCGVPQCAFRRRCRAIREIGFQDALQDPVPLRETQWLGTHNSFNSLSDSFTVSHADSNQQLSLAQQLDIDVRALELDLHYLPRLEGHGAPGVTVCHGLGPKNANLGCTVEPLLATVLPQIANWLNAPGHTEEVILLYLEDQLKNASAYESVVATLDQVLRRADGTSLIYRPNPARRATNGCVPLPLDVSREEIRASGARAVLVGSCAPGWSAAVFDWSGVELESGSNSGYRPYPACDATYGRGVYAWRLVRYYEDSTLATALANPTRPPANPQALTPPKVQAMTDCGVNLFGFDQLLPEDGRIQASLWSWAPDEPRAGAGACALQGADGRWVAASCGDPHPAACRDAAGRWTVTPAPVVFAGAALACTAIGADFTLPRTGNQNARLHAVAGPAGGAWVHYLLPP